MPEFLNVRYTLKCVCVLGAGGRGVSSRFSCVWVQLTTGSPWFHSAQDRPPRANIIKKMWNRWLITHLFDIYLPVILFYALSHFGWLPSCLAFAYFSVAISSCIALERKISWVERWGIDDIADYDPVYLLTTASRQTEYLQISAGGVSLVFSSQQSGWEIFHPRMHQFCAEFAIL